MKEESVRHREMENQRHREVSTLKKQTRKNESKIKSLEAEKRMKELALKRKNEEVRMGSKTLSIHICTLRYKKAVFLSYHALQTSYLTESCRT